MAAVIANEFTEAADDLYLSALIEIGLVLFVRHARHQRAVPPPDLERDPGSEGAAPKARRPRRLRLAAGRGMNRTARRKALSGLVVVLCGAAVALALVPLVFVFVYVLQQGFSSLNWDFFTKMPKPVGETGGGMANAIVGTLILIGIASARRGSGRHHRRRLPLRVRREKFASLVRFTADVLNGVPSIVIGIFAYGLVVLPMKHFSALAGGLALGFMMIPIITRTTEELLNLVPGSAARRRAGARRDARARRVLGDGAGGAARHHDRHPRWRSRAIAGETAPLLFTAFNNRFFSTRLDQPIASLPVQIFTYADLALRRLAPAGLGGRARARGVRLHLLRPGARRHAAAREDASHMSDTLEVSVEAPVGAERPGPGRRERRERPKTSRRSGAGAARWSRAT